MGIQWSDVAEQSNGGTEIMGRKLESVIDADLMSNFQIVPSRLRGELDPTKIRIFWAHDTADDPESMHLAGGGWRKYHRLVFVSNYQMQTYIKKFEIPWSRCQVILNAIEPINPAANKTHDKIRLVYHSTPHRGLNLLVPVFNKLCETHSDIHLDVFSSFKLYGWGDNDTPFQPLFDLMAQNENITSHGTVSNDVVRAALSNAHIFSYPSTWVETSCLCLMEAMSAGLMCVHPNLGALPETAANWTMQYQWDEDQNRHASVFYHTLNHAIEVVRQNPNIGQLASQKAYTDVFYNWKLRKMQWETFLISLMEEPREFEKETKPVFTYRA
jgi:glycosyltransferase involved in cell wall biosynthesis